MKKKYILCILFVVVLPLIAAWSGPVTIKGSADILAMDAAPQSKMVRDANGVIYVSYRDYLEEETTSYFQNYISYSRDNGVSWAIMGQDRGVGPVAWVPGYHQGHASIALDGDGVIHVVWTGRDSGNNGAHQEQIKYCRYKGGQWSAWQNIAEVSGYSGQAYWQKRPSIAVGFNNELYVTWCGLDSSDLSNTQIKFATSPDGGDSWSILSGSDTWKNINDSFPGFDHFAATVLPVSNSTYPNGLIYLFYIRTIYVDIADARKNRGQICYKYSTDNGATWSANNTVSVAPESFSDNFHMNYDLALDSAGRLHIAAVGGHKTFAQLSNILMNTSDWIAQYTVGTDGNSDGIIADTEIAVWEVVQDAAASEIQRNADNISLAVDDADNIHFVWHRAKDYKGDTALYATEAVLFYRMKSSGGSWGNSAQISTSDFLLNFHPSIRCNPNFQGEGELEMVWMGTKDKNGPYEVLYIQNSAYNTASSGAGAVDLNVTATDAELGLEDHESTAYPNPVNFCSDPGIVFSYNFPRGVIAKKEVSVYKLDGQMIFHDMISSKAFIEVGYLWDGVVDDDELIDPGLYFYTVTVEYLKGRKETSEVKQFKVLECQ